MTVPIATLQRLDMLALRAPPVQPLRSVALAFRVQAVLEVQEVRQPPSFVMLEHFVVQGHTQKRFNRVPLRFTVKLDLGVLRLVEGI
jgi:hypothetical protein